MWKAFNPIPNWPYQMYCPDGKERIMKLVDGLWIQCNNMGVEKRGGYRFEHNPLH